MHLNLTLLHCHYVGFGGNGKPVAHLRTSGSKFEETTNHYLTASEKLFTDLVVRHRVIH